MSQTNINTNTWAGNTNPITPEETDGAEVAAVAETIAERQSLNIHLKER